MYTICKTAICAYTLTRARVSVLRVCRQSGRRTNPKRRFMCKSRCSDLVTNVSYSGFPTGPLFQLFILLLFGLARALEEEEDDDEEEEESYCCIFTAGVEDARI